MMGKKVGGKTDGMLLLCPVGFYGTYRQREFGLVPPVAGRTLQEGVKRCLELDADHNRRMAEWPGETGSMDYSVVAGVRMWRISQRELARIGPSLLVWSLVCARVQAGDALPPSRHDEFGRAGIRLANWVDRKVQDCLPELEVLNWDAAPVGQFAKRAEWLAASRGVVDGNHMETLTGVYMLGGALWDDFGRTDDGGMG